MCRAVDTVTGYLEMDLKDMCRPVLCLTKYKIYLMHIQLLCSATLWLDTPSAKALTTNNSKLF